MVELDRLIHQPVRLRIMALLVKVEPEARIGFTTLRDTLDLSDGNLSAHLRKLEEARYVTIDKTFVARKPQTFVQATSGGRERFREHVAALEAILTQNNQGEIK